MNFADWKRPAEPDAAEWRIRLWSGPAYGTKSHVMVAAPSEVERIVRQNAREVAQLGGRIIAVAPFDIDGNLLDLGCGWNDGISGLDENDETYGEQVLRAHHHPAAHLTIDGTGAHAWGTIPNRNDASEVSRCMTVAELIAKLQTMPQELPVVVVGAIDGDPGAAVNVEERTFGVTPKGHIWPSDSLLAGDTPLRVAAVDVTAL